MDTNESSLNSSNSSFSFFYKNLTVTGFYEENALFMTVKELFDNSVDALSNLKTGEEKKIEILIKEHNKDLSFYEIVCRDNGEGIKIKDLENFGEMFLTSKEKCKTTGKFGIGLKTILLYSFKTAYGFLHIKIKIEKDKIWDFILVMDKSLSHTFVQNFQEYRDEKWNWTVEISVILKINDKYIYDKRILLYIKLTLLWKSFINVKYACISENFEYICNNKDYKSLADSTNKGVNLMKIDKDAQLGKRYRGAPYKKNDKREEKNAINRDNIEYIFELLIDHGVSLLVKQEYLSSFNFNLSVITNVRKSNKITSNVLNMCLGVIFLIRYANAMPLIGTNADCSLRNYFKNFLKLHGPQFGIEPFSMTENVNEDILEEFINLDSFKDIKQICDIFYVKKSDKSTWNVIFIGVDVNGSDISFGNLNKNSIKEGEYLSNLTYKCLLNIFNKMKKELPQEFESVSDYRLRQALNIYGTQLATSLSKIILKGREEFQNKVFYLLNEKKKQSIEKSGKNKTDNFNTPVERINEETNEKQLIEVLYHHIKEKILALNNDKVNENVNKKNESSDASSAFSDIRDVIDDEGNDYDDGVEDYYEDEDERENDEENDKY